MKRWNNDDFEHAGGPDDEWQDYLEENDIEELIDKSGEFLAEEVFIAYQQLRLQILQLAIKVAKRSWFWRFKSIKKRLELIKEAYIALNGLIGEGESED